MNIFYAFLLGVIQGIAEFLPISSSGHLVLVQRLLGIEGDLVAFDVVLHLGSLVAVVIVLRSELWQLIRKPFSTPSILLMVATVPTVIIALLFKDFFEAAFEGSFLGFGFLISALLLYICDRVGTNKPRHPTLGNALIMGTAQGLAILPGLSRSGTTMFGGIVSGLDKQAAIKTSFLMSVPIILASAVVKLPQIGAMPPAPLLVGFVASAVFALASVKFMLGFVKRRLAPFVVYLSVLGVFLLLNEYLLFWF